MDETCMFETIWKFSNASGSYTGNNVLTARSSEPKLIYFQ